VTTDNQQLPITQTLARLGMSFRHETLPEDVRFLARQCFLDWLGVTLAGSREPLTQILLEEVGEEGGNPQALLIGLGRKATIHQAAMVNGSASHALDYDDVQWEMSGHPSVPIVPGLLALTEHLGASGAEFMAAFVAGFETECRIGLLVNPGHYAKGWHATGTLGTFGSAAACASLLRLDQERWQHTLGIAAAQAAGLKSMFGTMCKPLHAGKAAANGLRAATLAARGFTSNPEALETAQGFGATQTATYQPERCLAGPANGFSLRSVLFKYHAACYGTHSTIEGVLRLKEDHKIDPGAVRAIRLRVPPGNLNMCNIPEPKTPLEGKFSLRFTAALALGYGDATETAFTTDRVNDPDLTSLRDRVTVVGDESITGATEVTVELADGRQLRAAVDVNQPATDLERQWQRLVVKFHSLAAPVIGEESAGQVVDAVSRLDDLPDLAAILRLCEGSPVAAPA
jgi:2-methylcitrate dehydratase PrpD